MSFPLTPRQIECLAFIQRSTANGGKAPSFDEIRKELRLESKSGVHRLISGLEDRGHIRRLPGRSRAIAVIDQSNRTALDFLPRDTKNYLIGIATVEGKSPEVLMAEWVRERCEAEHKLANDYAEFKSA